MPVVKLTSTKKHFWMSLGVLALALSLNTSSPRPAWAVICQNAGAPAGDPTAGATDGGEEQNTACGQVANASGASGPIGHTAIGFNSNASGKGGSNVAVGGQADAQGDNSV